MNPAPIVLFVYNRPAHTRRTLDALAGAELADRSILYVYCDGPKRGATVEDLDKIAETRDLVKSRNWCGEVHIIESEVNKGLAGSIVGGVTEVINRHERVIVLEDDIVMEPGFLRFMNKALTLYEDVVQVMQVSGGIYDAALPSGTDCCFLRVMYCHGWATWKRAWAHYNGDVLEHLAYFDFDQQRRRDFDIDGSAYFLRQLRRNLTGEIDTWAVRWYASWLRAGGLALFPGNSLVTNIGFDGSGVHCGEGSRSYLRSSVPSVAVERISVEEDQEMRARVAAFWCRYRKRAPGVGEMDRQCLGNRVADLVVSLVRKVTRKILTILFPNLRPLLGQEGEVSWHRVITGSSFVRIGKHVKIREACRLRFCIVGDGTYIGRDAVASYTEIGKFCSIGPNLCCGGGTHPVDGISTAPSFYSSQSPTGISYCPQSQSEEERKKITIGNDVFIGVNVTILDGVTIGDGAVVGAGCVVSKDVPPYAIVIGNPMRVLRYRFDDGLREKLQRVKWWDWPEEQLPLIVDEFFNVEEFVDRYSDSGSALRVDSKTGRSEKGDRTL